MRFWAFQPTAAADEIDMIIHGPIRPSSGWDGEKGARQFREDLAAYPNAKKINVSINSGGGDAFAGIAIHSMLQQHPAAVVCTVEGLAGSAASLIAMAGTTRMSPGSMMMIHNPSVLAMGESSDLRKTADVLDKLRDGLVSIYQAKTGKTADELREMLNAETWMDPQEAVDAGFADEVLGGQAVTALAQGETIYLNSVEFPGASLPERIQAMAKQKKQSDFDKAIASREKEAVAGITREMLAEKAPQLLADLLQEGRRLAVVDVEATAKKISEESKSMAERLIAAKADGYAAGIASVPTPQPSVAVTVTRESLVTQHPELLAALLDEGKAAGHAEGHAAGVTAERTRLQAIDAVAKPGHEALVAAARYAEPCTAEALAYRIVQAEMGNRSAYLANAGADAAGAIAPPAVLPLVGATVARAQAAADRAREDEIIDAAAAAWNASHKHKNGK